MKNILVTGASGFFGRAVAEELQKLPDSYRFTGVSQTERPQPADARWNFLQTDLLDHSTHRDLFTRTKPETCIHLAWHVPPKEFWTSPENEEWLVASVNLFREFCEAGGKTFIGAGSCAEYEWADGTVLNEKTTPLRPATLYGACKNRLREEITALRDQSYPGVTIIWPRIAYFFGEGEPAQKLFSRLAECLRKQEPMFLLARSASRPYAHVRHLGQCYAALAAGEFSDATFNLSGGHQRSFEEIVRFMATILGADDGVITFGAEKDHKGEPLNLEISTAGFQHYLGYEIEDSFFEDVRKFLGVAAKTDNVGML